MTEKKEIKEKKMNLYQKLIEIRKCVPKLEKDAIADIGKYKYKYATGSQVLEAIRPKMDELGILVITRIANFELRDDLTFIGNVEYEFIDADNPSDKILIPWPCIGKQNDPSKSFGSALTYGERFLFYKQNNIPTDDLDPDAQKPNDKFKSTSQQQSYNKEKPKQATKESEEGINKYATPRQREVLGFYPIFIASNNFPNASDLELLTIAKEIYEKAGMYGDTKPSMPNNAMLTKGRAWHIIDKLKKIVTEECCLQESDANKWWENIPDKEKPNYRWWGDD